MQQSKDFRRGQRVQLHPACDLWMRGARFGTVERIGRRFVWVRLDTFAAISADYPNGILRRFHPGNLEVTQ